MPLNIEPIQVQSKFPVEKKPSLDPAQKQIYTDVFSLQNAFRILFKVLDNTFEKIQDYINAGIGEAPIDGQIYGRKNAAWEAIAATGGAAIMETLNQAAYDALRGAPATTVTAGNVGTLYDLAVSVSIGGKNYVILMYSTVSRGTTYVNATNAKYTVPAGKTAKYFASSFDNQTGNNWSFYKSQVYNTTTTTAVVGPTGSGASLIVPNNTGMLSFPIDPSDLFPNTANATVSAPLASPFLPAVASAGQQILLRNASGADSNTRTVSAIYVFLIE